MKRILISLLTLGCFAAGADKVTLDTKLINADGEASSLYSSPDLPESIILSSSNSPSSVQGGLLGLHPRPG